MQNSHHSYKKKLKSLTYFDKTATSCRITFVSNQTKTNWSMILNTTLCVDSTDSRAWIFTFVVNTCFCTIAIRVLNTFRSAAGVRISEVFWQTTARSSSISFLAFSICAARRWIARFSFLFNWWRYTIMKYNKL